MKTTALITEYNPFHNGHKLHIEKAKKITDADFCVCVMSGNYVQRGEPAMLDKYFRTMSALRNGADAVIELPVMFASASAEIFSSSAIFILDKLGLIDNLCFGTEIGDLGALKKISSLLAAEPAAYKNILKSFLDKGLSYPSAREAALSEFSGKDFSILQSPNNILGIEYLKALEILNSRINPLTIAREGAEYHSGAVHNNLASATAIRKAVYENRLDEIKNTVPDYELFKKNCADGAVHNLDLFSSYLHFILAEGDREKLRGVMDISEGLENRILEASRENFLIGGLVQKIKTKRYTHTRLQRVLLHTVLNITQKDFEYLKTPRYVRILGFRRDSLPLLHEIKKKASLPVFTNLKDAFKILDADGLKMLKKELYASDLYYLARDNSPVKNHEFQKPVVII